MMLLPFLSKTGYNKVITTQEEFNNMVIEENDNILLEDDFIGSIDITEENVTIKGGGISGAEDISGLTWTDEGSDIWSTTMVTNPKWINIDGGNAKLAVTDWKILTGITSTNQINITHSDVSSYTSIVGSYIVFQDRVFSYSERYTITAYDGAGLVTLDRHRDNVNIGSGDTYKLFNDEEYIVGFNEWIWRDDKVKIKSNVNPNTLNITKSTYDYGVNITANNCTIENTEFKNQYAYAVISDNDNLTMLFNKIHDIRGQGIKLAEQSFNNTILNNTITDVGHNGIWFSSGDTFNIKNNTITNIGMGNNIGWNNKSFNGVGYTSGTAVKFNVNIAAATLDATNIYIENNIIDNCAYNGISLHIGQNGSIIKNVVTNTNNLLNDGAGIYCFHYRNTELPFSGFVIKENFVEVSSTGDFVFGIYIDNRCANNEISNNVINSTSGGGGFMLNVDTKEHNIKNNTIYALNNRAIWIREFSSLNHIYTNKDNLINDNIIISGKEITNLLEFLSDTDIYAANETSDNNYYVSPYGTVVLNDGSEKTLSQLQSTYTQDANSTELTDYIITPDPENEILIITNPTYSNLSGVAPLGNWYNVDSVLITNYSIPAWGSLVLLKDLI